jgi:Mn2+/Fe2+ NRAMP family transporter
MSKDRVAAEREMLVQAREKGTGATILAYGKLSGPGWLQSALTLGGGSLASSLYLGVLAGVSMMWLQPFAMVLGIIMLSAISYVTLSTGERPFRAINRHISPIAGWGWLLASLAANMVWALPQYSLCHGVIEKNLLPEIFGPGGALAGTSGKWVVSLCVLAVSTAVVWSYGGSGWGVKLYEWALKGTVAFIVACFVGVVVRMSFTGDGLEWGAIFAGFIPSFKQFFEPAAQFQVVINSIPDEAARTFWTAHLVAEQRDVMLSAAATAVGINMTFLLPYSLLSRGWDRDFRGLAVFDLSTGMFIPFMLATSAVVIASSSQFHAQLPAGVDRSHGSHFHGLTDDLRKKIEPVIAKREKAVEADVHIVEEELAYMLIRRDAYALATSLEPLTGKTIANYIFGFGVLAMAMSTISLLMLISGFVVCEIMDVPQKGWPHRLGCMLAASGIFWIYFWQGDARFWLAIITSVFAITLLPIAYITFYLMMNRDSILGEDRPRGFAAIRWNVGMAVAAGSASAASLYVIFTKLQALFGRLSG